MTSIQQLNKMKKIELIGLIEYLWSTESASQHEPAGFSTESSYKDALYSGYIDTDLEFTNMTPGLSNVVIEGTTITLNGDEVKIVPEYRNLQLYCKGFKITGLVKTEIIAYMISKMHAIKVGEYAGWDKYFVEFKGHTIVCNIKGSLASMKLLKNDYMAKKLYERRYTTKHITQWRELDKDEAIYGSKDISIPTAIDSMLEDIEEATGVLERGLKYKETANLIELLGWYNEPPDMVIELQQRVEELEQEICYGV